MATMTRRQFAGYGCLSAGIAATPMGRTLITGPDLPAPRPVMPEGTTLERTVRRPHGRGYLRLEDGGPRRAVLRTDLAERRSSRAARTDDLATLVQLTDLHVTDVQHPLRFEYLDRLCRTGHRPQELLTTHGAAALVDRVNQLRGGPFTGRPVDVVVTTGDNTDNNSRLELDWVLRILAGGRIHPSSGDPSTFEGVASAGLTDFWQPEGQVADTYARAGFPVVRGLLEAATAPFVASGLDAPWLVTMGNHDNTSLGTLPQQAALQDWALGDRKVFSAHDDAALVLGARLAARTLEDGPRLPESGAAELVSRVSRSGDTRSVTPDERRAPFTSEDYVRVLQDVRHTGAGPRGHGYGPDADPTRLYFAHRVTGRVVALSLDTTNPAGGADGSLGRSQLDWLEDRLVEHRDDYVVVLSHHPSTAMQNLAPDPRSPAESRHSAADLVDLLHQHRQVLAWINGHTHRNRITAHRHPDVRRSFWEIGTASHVDAPQQARVVEMARNSDGTVSVFTTLIDALAPTRASYDDLSPAGLASLYRELAFNDLSAHDRSGTAADGNAELLLVDPMG